MDESFNRVTAAIDAAKHYNSLVDAMKKAEQSLREKMGQLTPDEYRLWRDTYIKQRRKARGGSPKTEQIGIRSNYRRVQNLR